MCLVGCRVCVLMYVSLLLHVSVCLSVCLCVCLFVSACVVFVCLSVRMFLHVGFGCLHFVCVCCCVGCVFCCLFVVGCAFVLFVPGSFIGCWSAFLVVICLLALCVWLVGVWFGTCVLFVALS